MAELVYAEGRAGILVAPAGRLHLVMLFDMSGDLIHQIEIVTRPPRLTALKLALPGAGGSPFSAIR